jgi:medium-chain acyl-[acyl-carrier-protein] hydrolase
MFASILESEAAASAGSPWLLGADANAQAPVTLICFGSAGSGGRQFIPWKARVPDWLQVVGVQLPGREERYRDAPVTDAVHLASLISREIGAMRHPRRPVYFGHSFGALLAYEVARRLSGTVHQPDRIVLASRSAPGWEEQFQKSYLLPDDAFIEVLRGYGGLDERITQNQRFRDFYLPVIRADLRANAEYRHTPGPALSMPITAVRGVADPYCSREELLAWERLTAGGFEAIETDGGHFFFKDDAGRVLDLIVERLAFERTGDHWEVR